MIAAEARWRWLSLALSADAKTTIEKAVDIGFFVAPAKRNVFIKNFYALYKLFNTNGSLLPSRQTVFVCLRQCMNE